MHVESKAQRIQALAYQLWEREGRPAGRDLDHWREAERQFESEKRRLDGAVDALGSGLLGDEAGNLQDTPGRAKSASSRQQTQPRQVTQSGSASLDGRRPRHPPSRMA